MRSGVETPCAQRAWGALNDSYRSDVNLLYPPHVVALGCLCLAAGSCNVDLAPWLGKLNVDLGQVGGPGPWRRWATGGRIVVSEAQDQTSGEG